MIRVVIVEDELLVRLGMKTILEQSKAPITVAGAFFSAQDALEWFLHYSADLLITDIGMTGMNGLELIKALRPRHPSMRTIVLSCFENFDYAREAYELGVEKYILKHELLEDELPDIVLQLFEEQDSQAGTLAALPQEGAENEEAGFILAGFVPLHDNDLEPDAMVDFDMVAGLLAEVPGPRRVRPLSLMDGGNLILLLEFAKGLPLESLAPIAESYYNNACRLLANYTSYHFFMALSPAFFSIDELHDNEAILRDIFPLSFYCRDTCLQRESPVFSNICPEITGAPAELLCEGPGLVAFAKTLELYFAHCRETLVFPDLVRVRATSFLHRMDVFLSNSYGVTLEEITNTPGLPANYIGVQRITGHLHLCRWLTLIIEQAAAYLESNQNKNNRMGQLLSYLQEHYMENITLDSLAANSFLSPAYLSARFHQKTGKTFTKYLCELRMQKAMELLRTSDMSIGEVALACGFQNSNYFSRLFKKSTGQTAGEYRKNRTPA